MGTPDLLKHSGYGGYGGYHGYVGYQQQKYTCGAWSLQLLGTPDLLKQNGYGGYGGYLSFQVKNIYAGLGY